MVAISAKPGMIFYDLELKDGTLGLTNYVDGLRTPVGTVVKASIFENDEAVDLKVVPGGEICLTPDNCDLTSVLALIRQQATNPTKPTGYWR